MLPPSSLSSALAQAFSTFSRRGDRAILDRLVHRLTRTDTVVADLRDLRPSALDELPDGYLRALGQLPVPRSLAHPIGRSIGHPPLIALPEGCAAATVNRFLREMSGTECLSAPHVDAQRDLVDFPVGTALRLFETTLPPPFLHNGIDVPVLVRLIDGAPSCVPPAPQEGDPLMTRLMAVSALRDALCSDDCRLDLPPTAAFGELALRLAGMLEGWHRCTAAGPRLRASAPGIVPTPDEQLMIERALRMVPRELLPAPSSVTIEQLLLRTRPPGTTPSPVHRQGLDEGDLSRIARALDAQWHIACPAHGEFRPTRLPRDLVTLARLQRWAWPDSAYAKPEPIDAQREKRHIAANCLRRDWEARQGFNAALTRIADLEVSLPEADLLRRMGVLQAEALAAQSRARSRRIAFADPLSQADDPS